MTETNTSSVQGVPAQQRGASGRTEAGRTGGTSLMTESGRTTIAEGVVAKISGLAAREISGVHDFGTAPARAFGALKGRMGVEDAITRGISVEVGERQAAVDIDLVIDYGVTIPDVAAAVRENVIKAVGQMCGLEVTEVNVTVDDVYLPAQDESQGTGEGARVR
ncbi:Asp23/Gls24 family envelope stress response protein [Microtetraspora sp. NBRC 16547]|uniref:Asp23/Gls24 family envelope stress response protein n=1 Tax=Microtetraspora sp. NBRC 16547 TaxID=3030993 RepID=UPI0024A310A8|nr:Asp23/Gls24 family envelope stress response protein [Microtetraspora sp. NBRC 16547]GLW98684.1 stress protein [Microtetraspora sp. NBRC 16547]